MRSALDTLKATDASVGSVNWETVRVLLWNWIEANGDHEVTTFKLWFITKKLRVRDLHEVFKLLLGPKPYFQP